MALLPVADPVDRAIRPVDVGLVAVVVAAVVVAEVLPAGSTASGAARLLAGTAGATPLLVRRAAPLAALSAAAAVTVACAVLGLPDWPAALSSAVTLWAAAARCGPRGSSAALAVAAVLPAVLLLRGEGASAALTNGSVLVVIWLTGRAVHRRDRASRAAERHRVARDLHDVVAHNSGLLVLRAENARHEVRRDPERADRELAGLADAGRLAGAQLRAVLGAVRSGRPSDPAAIRLDGLLDEVRAAGGRVELHVHGAPRPVPDAVAGVLFHVVREALSNAVRHGDPHGQVVDLHYPPAAVEVRVRDDGRGPAERPGAGPGTGSGLTGLHERVGSVGGRLVAGPRRGGGFEVGAWLPTAR